MLVIGVIAVYTENMENTTLIRRSSHGMQVQMLLSAVVAIIVGLIATWFFELILGWTTGGGALAEKFAWVAIALLWIFSSLKLWFDWKAKRYEISPDSLIVHAKAGRLGSAQTLYRYESIVSVRMTQGFLGKQFGYGDIRVTIANIDHEVVMNDIENPTTQLRDIQRRMAERSGPGAAAYAA